MQALDAAPADPEADALARCYALLRQRAREARANKNAVTDTFAGRTVTAADRATPGGADHEQS